MGRFCSTSEIMYTPSIIIDLVSKILDIRSKLVDLVFSDELSAREKKPRSALPNVISDHRYCHGRLFGGGVAVQALKSRVELVLCRRGL